MTATLSRERDGARAVYEIERLRDPDIIREMLLPDKAYAAYALGQLQPGLSQLAEWYSATGPNGRALLLHSRGGLGKALFAHGDAAALEAALRLHPGPRFSFGSLRPEHRAVVEKYFIFTRPQTMFRMSVHRDSFKAVEGPAVRLYGTDIAAINRLYAAEGGSAYQATHIEDGIYYGVYAGRNLASIAGTHVVSSSEGVAVVGNVFTHPRYRGQGLARITTSATTAELLETCPLVVLTVESGNDPAVKAYQRLGYETVCTLHETPIIRKEPLGAISFTRRLLAGWRGAEEGKEIVIR